MTNIHENNGYQAPELTTTYLGLFEDKGVWFAAREMVNNQTGRKLKVPNTLDGLAQMADATLKYEDGKFLLVEIQPLIQLTFQHFKLAGLGKPTEAESLAKGLAAVEKKGMLPEGSGKSLKEIFMAHRDQWPDRLPITFFAGLPPEPVKPVAGAGVAASPPKGNPA